MIVDAARERLTTLGYDATTVGDLARQLNISKAAISYYFPTKDMILDEFVTPVLDQMEAVADLADTADEALAAFLSVIVEHHDLAVWIDTDQAVQNHPVYGPRLTSINERLIKVIIGGSRRKADRIRALSVLGGLWRPARELPTADLISHHAEIVHAALASS